jgi:hypothetical protein
MPDRIAARVAHTILKNNLAPLRKHSLVPKNGLATARTRSRMSSVSEQS